MSTPVLLKENGDDASRLVVEEAIDPHASFQIVRDAVANYSSTLISGLVGILMVPILLRGLGAESYGLWITALVLGTIVPLDLGLGWSLARDIAVDGTVPREQTILFVKATGNLFLLLGIVGGIAIGIAGLPLSRTMHLSVEARRIAPWVFCIAGISFLADQMLAYVMSIFHGLRRFGAANGVSASIVLVRALGSIALISSGQNVLAVAIWQTAVSGIVVLVGLFWIGRIEPNYRLRLYSHPRKFDLTAIRAHLPFGIASQFTMSGTNLIWQSTPLIVGILRGPTAIVPYYVGQKFPLAVSLFNWRAAEPIFPATSEKSTDLQSCRRILEVGSRWILMVSLPACALLSVLGPNLLRAWLGNISDEHVLILRVTTVAALADALGVGALHVLWALGEVKTLLRITMALALATIILTLGILFRFDAEHAIWALLLPIAAGALLFLFLACRRCSLHYVSLLKTCIPLLVPTLICIVVALVIQRFAPVNDLKAVMSTGLLAVVAYVIGLYFFATSNEEKMFARSLFRRS